MVSVVAPARRPTLVSVRHVSHRRSEGAGANVGLGVDGVASNENGLLFSELRQSLVCGSPQSPTRRRVHAMDALDLATGAAARCCSGAMTSARSRSGGAPTWRVGRLIWDGPTHRRPRAGARPPGGDLLVGGERVVHDGSSPASICARRSKISPGDHNACGP